jgi:predicted CopG family antitoxin
VAYVAEQAKRTNSHRISVDDETYRILGKMREDPNETLGDVVRRLLASKE